MSWDNDTWGENSWSGKEESKKLVDDAKIYVRFLDKMHNRVNNIEELIQNLPKNNQQIRIITQKSFNAFAILLFIVQNRQVKNVDLAIYRIDKNSVEGLKRLVLDKKIERLRIVISSFFRTNKRAEIWHNNLVAFAKANKNVEVCYCWNHAKVMCISTIDNEYYVIEGSGNLSDNARIEQYLFEQCKDTYEFHCKWIKELSENSLLDKFSKV